MTIYNLDILLFLFGTSLLFHVQFFRDTLIYSKWITNKDLLYSTWNSTQCHMPAWMVEGFRGEWIHVYVCLSPCVCVFSVVSDCLQPHGLQSSRLLCPWNFPGKNTGVGYYATDPGIEPQGVSHIVSRFFTVCATRNLTKSLYPMQNKKFKVWEKKEYISN